MIDLLFWPASMLGMLLGYLGHGYRRVILAAVGVALCFPFLLYLAAAPTFRFWAVAIILTSLGSVLALAKGRQPLALALFTALPVFLLVVFLKLYRY